MAQRLDFVSLEIGGTRLDRWQQYDVDSDLLIPADAFSLSVDVPTEDADAIRDLVAPGAAAKLYVERVQPDGSRHRSLQMTGHIDSREMDVSRQGGLTLSVNGRDMAGVLTDANVNPGLICDQHSDLLIDLLQAGVSPYGIEVIADDSSERSILTGERGSSTQATLERREARTAGVSPASYSRGRLDASRAQGVPMDELLGASSDTGARFASGQSPSDVRRVRVSEARPNPGETIWDFFTRHARRFGLMLWTTADGKLVLGAPDWRQAPTYRLVRRVRNNPSDPNNIISGGLKESALNSYSSITVMGRGSRADGTRGRIREEVLNPDWPSNAPDRPRYLNDPRIRDSDAAVRRGLRELMSGRAKQYAITYEVDGHGQGGRLWAQGTTARVIDDRLGIDGTFFVVGRRFRGSRQDGTTTQVRLIKLESFEI